MNIEMYGNTELITLCVILFDFSVSSGSFVYDADLNLGDWKLTQVTLS